MAWDLWDNPVMGGDGAQQERAPVTLFVNSKVKERRAREQARSASSSRRGKQVSASQRREIARLARGGAVARKPWWK